MNLKKLKLGKSVVVSASHWGVAPMEKKKWTGTKPEKCDLCAEKITDFWVDGKTRQGPWGNMCLNCHAAHGVGFGTGRGQQYDAKTLLKVKG